MLVDDNTELVGGTLTELEDALVDTGDSSDEDELNDVDDVPV